MKAIQIEAFGNRAEVVRPSMSPTAALTGGKELQR
jgi:hypothetical protein